MSREQLPLVPPGTETVSSAPEGRGLRVPAVAVTVLFWVLFAAVVAAQVAVIVPEFVTTRLWEDEAFNLTVPLNLLAGHGYSSAGLLSSGQLASFDVRISTGPVVLLPVAAVLATGIDPVIGGRLVPLLFYIGLLAALWIVGRRIGGRWGALFAIVAPLVLCTNQLPSPVQGPVDVLGEFPAAALLAWAVVVLRKRPWLAGLMLGLALQTKFVALLSAPALLVYAWFLIAGQPWRARLMRCVWAAIWAVIPTALYWLVVLISLGPSGFVLNVRQFLWFLRNGGQQAATTLDQKLTVLVNSWFVGEQVVIAVIVAAIVLCALGLVLVIRAHRAGRDTDALVRRAGAHTTAREVTLLLITAGVNLVVWVGWWSVSRTTPTWIRYPAPGLLVSIPIFAAAAVLSVRMLWLTASGRVQPVVSTGAAQAHERPAQGLPPLRWWRWMSAAVAALACVVIVLAAATSVQKHVVAAGQADYGETLSQQRDVAAQLADLDVRRFATPWGSQLGAILLSGVPFTSEQGPDAAELPTVLWTPELSDPGQAAFAAELHAVCADDAVRIATQYAVCRLK